MGGIYAEVNYVDLSQRKRQKRPKHWERDSCPVFPGSSLLNTQDGGLKPGFLCRVGQSPRYSFRSLKTIFIEEQSQQFCPYRRSMWNLYLSFCWEKQMTLLENREVWKSALKDGCINTLTLSWYVCLFKLELELMKARILDTVIWVFVRWRPSF